MISMMQEAMTVDDWIHVADCPIQRNTEMHAARARNKHLKTCSPTHLRVSAARLSTGEMYKLDGHTRAYLWQEGSLTPPGDQVMVDMYHVDNMSQVEELYKQFDSQMAVETATDRLFGAFRLHAFSPESTLIRSGGVTSAVTLCARKQARTMNIYQIIEPFIPALGIIDRRLFGFKQFPTGVLAAMILTVMKHGEEAMLFWERYNADEGVKNGRTRDAVQALTELVTAYRGGHRMSTDYSSTIDLCGKTISTFYADREGRSYTSGVRATDLSKYLEQDIFSSLSTVATA